MTTRRSVPRQMRRPTTRGAITARDQVLARRRIALVVIVGLVPVTLIAALMTGSTTILFVNLFVDVLLAGYIAMLLSIKQNQGGGRPQWSGVPDDEVRVL